MKKLFVKIVPVLLVLIVFCTSCKKDPSLDSAVIPEHKLVAFDSTEITTFFKKFPQYAQFKSELQELYQKRSYNYVWFDQSGRTDFAEVLYNRINQIKDDGVLIDVPNKKQIDSIFEIKSSKIQSTQSDLMISSMYFFYTKNVYQGLDPKVSKDLGWYLPREKVSFVSYLDTLLNNPNLIKKDKSELISQYYLLKNILSKYRDIEKKGGWITIEIPKDFKSLKIGDSSQIVIPIRERLLITGELSQNNKSAIVDQELIDVVNNYEVRHFRKPSNTITAKLIKSLNIPVTDRIKTIIINMERCRWITPDVMDAPELIAVNIPSFRMQYIKDRKPVIDSKVVVGKELHETVVFSGKMSYLVFSPYWNVPRSIINNEIKPAMEANPNYLEKHNMEYNNGNIRQKPGPNNSLGLVKFMFPNSNNIYLHDTPAKSLFERNDRALSHGCVRVEKARDLAIEILRDDPNWDEAKIDKAMHSGKENSYTLKRKIPVYIGYFTAWANKSGQISFYEDIYNKDQRLAEMLFKE